MNEDKHEPKPYIHVPYSIMVLHFEFFMYFSVASISLCRRVPKWSFSLFVTLYISERKKTPPFYVTIAIKSIAPGSWSCLRLKSLTHEFSTWTDFEIKLPSHILCLGMLTYFFSSIMFSVTVTIISASIFAMTFSMCLLAFISSVAFPTPTEAVIPTIYKHKDFNVHYNKDLSPHPTIDAFFKV